MRAALHTLLSLGLLLLCMEAGAQEVLSASRIQARARHKDMPSVGLPLRSDGSIDPLIQYKDGRWRGAESLRAREHWLMGKAPFGNAPEALREVMALAEAWAAEKPSGTVHVVIGPHGEGYFAALCKKTRTGLGWKSLAFAVPGSGIPSGRSPYLYSHSVNWLEGRIGYNLFPKLPSHLQEMIEEMSATELLSPFQEYEREEAELPDPEIDYDWMLDQMDM